MCNIWDEPQEHPDNLAVNKMLLKAISKINLIRNFFKCKDSFELNNIKNFSLCFTEFIKRKSGLNEHPGVGEK